MEAIVLLPFLFGWWIVCGVIGGLIGRSHGKVGKGFILGALFGPIGWALSLFDIGGTTILIGMCALGIAGLFAASSLINYAREREKETAKREAAEKIEREKQFAADLASLNGNHSYENRPQILRGIIRGMNDNGALVVDCVSGGQNFGPVLIASGGVIQEATNLPTEFVTGRASLKDFPNSNTLVPGRTVNVIVTPVPYEAGTYSMGYKAPPESAGPISQPWGSALDRKPYNQR